MKNLILALLTVFNLTIYAQDMVTIYETGLENRLNEMNDDWDYYFTVEPSTFGYHFDDVEKTGVIVFEGDDFEFVLEGEIEELENYAGDIELILETEDLSSQYDIIFSISTDGETWTDIDTTIGLETLTFNFTNTDLNKYIKFTVYGTSVTHESFSLSKLTINADRQATVGLMTEQISIDIYYSNFLVINHDNYSVKIYNLSGQLVSTQKEAILEPNIYIVVVTTDQGEIVKKIAC